MENAHWDEPNFKLLFNSSPNLYLVLNPDFQIVAVNDSYLKSLDRERSELIGQDVFKAFPPNVDDPGALAAQNLKTSLEMVLKTGYPHSMDVEKYSVRVGESHEDRYWTICNSPVFDDDQNLKYIIHRAEDVTEFMKIKRDSGGAIDLGRDFKSKKGLMETEVLARAHEIQEANVNLKAANDQLAMREKELRALYERLARVDRQKTQFFANISHELRTPLTLILGHVDRLLSDAKMDSPAQGSLMTVKRNAQALLRHVSDLLDVARFDAGELKPRYVNLDVSQLFHVLSESFAVLASERHINFSMEAPLALIAQLDSQMMQRILLNVLSNAFKFTPDYGVIRGRVEAIRKPQGDVVRFSVSDSGPGVPTHLRHNIFERFFQIQESTGRTGGGTGLGLAIVKDFTDILGGTVEVRQSTEGGAQFVVEIPVKAPQGTEVFYHEPVVGTANFYQKEMDQEVRFYHAQADNEVVEKEDQQKPLVLVVEDNEELRRFVVDALKSEYRCVTAQNGLEGFEKARDVQPDLVLTDLIMPQYDGEFLIEKLRSESLCKDIPILILTAKVDEALKVRLLDLGVQEYLFKPFMTEEILVRVRNEVRDFRARKLLQRELEFKEDNIESLAREVTFKNQELQRLSRLKDEFLATLSHELRTPVSVIFGYAEILSEEMEDREVMEEAIEAITRNAKIQLRLVSDLLDISKSITGKIVLEAGESDVRSILDDVLYTAESAARAKKILIETVIESNVTALWADSVRMSQIIWNLVSNAIKFTPVEGKIVIRVSQQNGMMEIAVQDSGKGIDPAFLPYIFDRFRQQDGSVTRKFGGLGLGLAIVKHLVELHGGTVRAESKGIGEGATFVVSIPAYQTMAGEKNTTRTQDSEILKGRSVLVVDDDPDTLQVITLILKKQGMNVLGASNPLEAQTVLRDLIPDVLISDIGMPEMNGYDFIRLVRGSDTAINSIPALALTAFASSEIETKALSAGFDVYLAKPIESKKLLQALSQLVHSRVYARL